MAVPARLAPCLSGVDLEAISRAVGEAESTTAGEIRVHIAHRLRPWEKPRARAIRQFLWLGMDQTRDATGVLLFLVLKNRRFEIVADTGIDRKVPARTWDSIAREIEARIQEDSLVEGICHGIREIGRVLAAHVPRSRDDADELPNEVSLDEPPVKS